MNLLVVNSATYTVHIHNVPGCNTLLYYRCWTERGMPLPRVEFLAPANAMEVTLQPHSSDGSSANDHPSLPPAPSPRFPPPSALATPPAAPLSSARRPPAPRKRGR